MTTTRKIVNIVAAPILLAACFGIASLMVSSKKSPPLAPKKEVVITVTYLSSDVETITPTINTFGNTQSFYSTSLSSQVGGEILEMSPRFEVGSTIDAGQWLAKINPADYKANLANRKAALANAKQALAEEQTRGLLAEEDWLAAGRSLSEANDLTLRKPQLAASEASVASAEAAVVQAELDLERATIRAPFDAIVEARNASPGDILKSGEPLGSLLATERIQVRLPLTPTQASRLKLPRHGSDSEVLQATLATPSLPGVRWPAVINRVEPLIDPKNQSVYLIGEILKPFADPNAFLPVGAFVDASISGAPIENIHSFPDSAVVEDAFVWTISPENTLAKQPLTIVFSQQGRILARIEKPLFDLPLKVLDLPLASLREGQNVKPLASASKTAAASEPKL